MAPLRWMEGVVTNDELPAIKGRVAPPFPVELKDTTDIGYTIVHVVVDEDGEPLSTSYQGTTPVYTHAMAESLPWWYTPGRRDGKAVLTKTQTAIIFNPASAAVKGTEATPRLLQADVVVDSRASGAAGQVIWARVNVDEQGEVTRVTEVSAELADVLSAGVRSWRFAPARRGGEPVASEVRVPFLVVSGKGMMANEVIPPKAIKQVDPVYPANLEYTRLQGNVEMKFMVEVDGRVTEAYVSKSLNPAFDAPALDAMRKSTFKPGTHNGVPRRMSLMTSVTFTPGKSYGRTAGYEVGKKADQSKLPPEFRYDTPASITASIQPVFPRALMKTVKQGDAQAEFVIGANGRVIHSRVVKADHPEMGEALLAALDYFEFVPAVKDGRPTQMLMRYEQKFGPRYDKFISFEEKTPGRILSAKKLDTPLKPISRRPPRFPTNLMDKVDKGEAVVEVLIDTEGAVRLPRIVSATDPAFGYAAAQAVVFWRFEAPKSGGKPAVVRVQVPFDFRLRDSADTSADK